LKTNIIQLAKETGRVDLAAHTIVYALLLQIQKLNVPAMNAGKKEIISGQNSGR
jgi:hypothetical protein